MLTGAGVSAESGLGTFRDLGGIWSQVRLEEVATPEAFAADPRRVRDFYDARRAQARAAAPNAAHEALARLERALGERLTLVTQNIDDLHERGGARRALHMHGSIFRALCAACGARADWEGPMPDAATCPACGRTGRMRPAVVWFGETPEHMDEIAEALARCDLFVSIGTSGAIYPAAGFVQEAKAQGARTLELNLEPSEGSRWFDETRLGPATRLVAAWVEEALAASGA